MESEIADGTGDAFANRNEFGHGNRSINHAADYGPVRDPLYVVIPISIIYVAIFFTGLLGNIVTCIVIARNRYMHTATNYYLFSLAVSDLLLLLSGLPQEMVAIWYKYPYMFGEAFCILRGLSAETSTNASILTITAFTVERYFAICHPFISQTISKLSRAVKLIVALWLVSLSFALPQAMQFGLVQFDNNPKMVMCMLKRKIIEHSFELSTFLFFIMPMTLITVLYILIGLKLRSSNVIKRNRGSLQKAAEQGGRKRSNQSSRRVIKMLVAIVVAFFICWAPFHAQRLIYIHGSSGQQKSRSKIMIIIYTVMTYISGVLYYVSTTINPILYHIMSLKFRESFKDTIARWCGLPSVKNHRGRRYAVLQRGQMQFSPNSSARGGPALSYDAYIANNLREETTISTSMNTAIENHGKPFGKWLRIKKRAPSALDTENDARRTEAAYLPRWATARGSVTMMPQKEFIFRMRHAELRKMRRSKSDLSSGSEISLCSVFRCARADEKYEAAKCRRDLGSARAGRSREGRCPRTRSSSDSGIMRSRSLCGGFSSNVSNSSLKDYDQNELKEELRMHLAEVFRGREY